MADRKFEVGIGYVPGLIDRISELHGRYYAQNWGFGSFFEAKVATDVAEFINRYNDQNDCIWSLSMEDKIHGSMAIDGHAGDQNIAHLRWFILSEALRGQGAGNYLMNQAMIFCKDRCFEKIYLWTFEGLESAQYLYEKFGFVLVEQHSGNQWGTEVIEQRYEVKL